MEKERRRCGLIKLLRDAKEVQNEFNEIRAGLGRA